MRKAPPSSRAGAMRDHAVFFLNGRRHEVGADHAGMMLADYLRYERGLTGTKIVCAEGDCGACSVLRVFPYSLSPGRYLAVNSCIATVAQMDGSSLVTVDALADGGELSTVQAAMLEANGSQCGFCTPGFVVALTGLVEKKICSPATGGTREPAQKHCGAQEVKNALTGNLCRCTGYQPIIDAGTGIDLRRCTPVAARFSSITQTKELKEILKKPLRMESDRFAFYAPKTTAEAAAFLARHPDARLAGAATDLGVVHNKGKIRLARLVSLHAIPELYEIRSSKGRVRVGARATLSELRNFLKDKSPEFSRFLDVFASPQIKNVATLIGNVSNASPIADTPPFLLVSNAVAHLVGPKGKRRVPLDEFYLDYRKTALRAGELIASIEFDLESKSESVAIYKVSNRKDLDISGVNAAFRVRWSDAKRTKVGEARLAMGGVAAIPLRLKKTEAFLKGKALTPETFVAASAVVREEMNPLSDLRGTAAYRRALVENLLARFFREQGTRIERRFA